MAEVEDHITATAQETVQQIIEKTAYKTLLESLQCPSMNERYSMIKDAHEGTFRWMFQSEEKPAEESLDQDSRETFSNSDLSDTSEVRHSVSYRVLDFWRAKASHDSLTWLRAPHWSEDTERCSGYPERRDLEKALW